MFNKDIHLVSSSYLTTLSVDGEGRIYRIDALMSRASPLLKILVQGEEPHSSRSTRYHRTRWI